MMVDETAEALREMAQHRGLKLIRSRRRKPGTGDFGKFGLTDDKGKPLLGIGDDGLTASAEDIEGYLRAGAASTWQQSAKIPPDRPAVRRGRKREDEVAAKTPVGRRGRADADPGGAVKRSDTSSPSSASTSPHSSSPEPERASEARSSPIARVRETASGAENETGKLKSKTREKPREAKPEAVEVEPTLVLRAAKPADAEGLAKLLSQLAGIAVSKDDVTRDLAALRKAGAGIHLAALGNVIGCVAWTVVPTLQRGPVGRLTVLVVDQDHRRQGIGTRLLAEAETALAKQGCTLVEAMSDIEIKNSHNFFRAAKFDQTSYRFARKIAQ